MRWLLRGQQVSGTCSLASLDTTASSSSDRTWEGAPLGGQRAGHGSGETEGPLHCPGSHPVIDPLALQRVETHGDVLGALLLARVGSQAEAVRLRLQIHRLEARGRAGAKGAGACFGGGGLRERRIERG